MSIQAVSALFIGWASEGGVFSTGINPAAHEDNKTDEPSGLHNNFIWRVAIFRFPHQASKECTLSSERKRKITDML